ncbi:stomatin 2 [Orientia tsutsugamushi str. Gilliam]|uniref:Stomatin 2 n=5 Tax=Orientia tsutsugamushi TaxID=784 RepID=A0A2U3QSD3_ORITS|nr:stomatin-like protein [Orientia tsutsugamushi]KJV74600.1 stomatin-like protein 2 [Orientia tsutsugamushi str. TA763]KJV52315.1 stomatin-like protein 2 [Orientia tsutsugamushi str. Kato PP]SPP24669.1 stomatin 2 [Orientia tsutsugamushi]SPR03851.1 stomatin 2 [Orientia tsutsugamushi]SPR03861.1 stomatin 2 [Orientia tsutsugamushi str. Gilliam]
MILSINIINIFVLVVLGIILFNVFKIVPQQQAWIIERLGKLHKVLPAGLNFIIPMVDRVAYKHTLKEQAIDVTAQTAISNDNVSLSIDGVLYVKIIDPIAASYGVSDPYYAITQLAQTTMRSEIGKIPLDKTFEERENLNIAIVTSINHAAANWGIQCMRYEIKDIYPPQSVLRAMELQVAAERQKRAQILESEGKRQSQINIAEAGKAEVVLNSEAAKIDQVNRAVGEAEAILLVAKATAEGIEQLAQAINNTGGSDAVSLRIAEQYIDALSKIAKETNTVIIPSNINDSSSVVTQALSIFDAIKLSKSKKSTNSENA